MEIHLESIAEMRNAIATAETYSKAVSEFIMGEVKKQACGKVIQISNDYSSAHFFEITDIESVRTDVYCHGDKAACNNRFIAKATGNHMVMQKGDNASFDMTTTMDDAIYIHIQVSVHEIIVDFKGLGKYMNNRDILTLMNNCKTPDRFIKEFERQAK